MEVKSKFFRCFSNPIYSYVNVCDLAQVPMEPWNDGGSIMEWRRRLPRFWEWGPRGEVPGEKEGTFLWTCRGSWAERRLVKKDVAFFLKRGGEGTIGTVPEGRSWVLFSTAGKKELLVLYLEEGSRKKRRWSCAWREETGGEE